MTVLGTMTFSATGMGCLDIIESGFDNGTHTILTGAEVIMAPILRRGRICVGPGGANPCVLDVPPVESATWGAIKAQYQD